MNRRLTRGVLLAVVFSALAWGQENAKPPSSVAEHEALAQSYESKDAEKLAVDSEKAAEYHRLRAKELQGK